ncbi:hypothetical protein [Nonomuraea sp. NEAU-A123]|uniref:hypothetical protein n=1 Tax=Nonomuraea sp. NEAU-A123 TaxID=2839649 RepID=UPI0027E098F0|nr:hypothetical protein [Nonomuraea sp. NEAU-A123]
MIVIDAGSPVPPFEQLRAQLARQIHDRTLAVGSRPTSAWPSTRSAGPTGSWKRPG